MKIALLLNLFLVSGLAHAQKSAPLFFPANQNSLQVLPQKFEYTVVDERRLQIGDIVIDANRFGFQVSTDTKDPFINFVWPAGLLTSGQLVIKDNAGKAIYSNMITPEKVKISAAEDLQEAGIRGEKAELLARNVSVDLLKSMRTLPFMQLCLFNEQVNTKIYLCSPEVYLNREDDGQYRIQPRSSTKKSSFVQINGKEVGPQGIVYLNDPDESLSFRSLSQNGATLEIETRMKAVDFKDIYREVSNGKLRITGVGAEPADDKAVLKREGREWQVELDPTRPILFLKGEGNIPLRQEFYVRGKLPLDSYRPQLSSGSRMKTYGRSLSLRGTAAPQTNLNVPTGKGLLQKKSGSSQFEWTLSNLPSGALSRHFIQVETSNGPFNAAIDLLRAHPYTLSSSILLITPENQGSFQVALQMWLENFLGSSFRWGFEGQYSTLIQKKKDEPDSSQVQFKALYRLKEGFHLIDPSPSIGFSYRNLTMGTTSLALLGLQYRHETNVSSKKWPISWFDWINYTGRVYLPSESGNLQYEYGVQAEVEALNQGFRKDLWYKYSAQLLTDHIKNTKSEINFGIEAGLIWQF